MADKSEKPIKMQLPNKLASAKIAALKGEVIKEGNPYQAHKATTESIIHAASSVVSFPITKSAQFAGSGASNIMAQPMFFSPLQTPQNWQIASKRKEVYQWARHYYENEPKVAAGIDFYSQFPINGFKLKCSKKSVLKFFERMVERLDLMYWLRMISHQRFLLGDVFVHTDIECPHCKGNGVDPDSGERCRHPDGTIARVMVLNPDWIEVMKTPISSEPQIVLLPDDEIKKIIQTKQPKFLYDQIPDEIKLQILSQKPILLSNLVTSHLRHGGVPYGTYGESLLRRLFTVLAYKTKLMTANWIIAERLILPIRVVKVGSDTRPADDDAINDIASQLASVANDPNLTIITHNNFEYEWFGASGKIHNINQELEFVGKEILDGLMLNQTLLNGEMAGYNSAQVGVEVMIRRIESWRNELARWIEKHIFLPVAKMQGFLDEEETKEVGETIYLYPRIEWNDLRLRDNTNLLQMYLTMQQSTLISAQTLLEKFELDYDLETERIREEQVKAMQNGQLMGGQQGGGMGGPPGGGMGGGGGGGPPGAGGMDMGAGGAPGAGGMPGGGGMDMGGGMGGGMAGGAGAAPSGGMGAAASGDQKIYRRGKGPKESEMPEPAKPVNIQLTKPESRMYRSLMGMKLPFNLYAQYKIPVPNESNFYLMDFALPDLGVDIEVDGEKWHSSQEDKQSDKQRDMTLASLGWRVLRFTEMAIAEQMDKVQQVIYKEVTDAAKEKKSRSKKAKSGKTLNYKTASFDPFDGCSVSVSKAVETDGE